MALKAQVPVVPVAIQGGDASMRKGSPIVRPTTVSVRIGVPVETRGMDLSDREKLADMVRARVEELLALGPVTLSPGFLPAFSIVIAWRRRFASFRRAWRNQSS